MTEPIVHDLIRGFCPERQDGNDWWKSVGKWPPDVFAVTSTILDDTGAYRYVVSPPTIDGKRQDWPPAVPAWTDVVEEAAEEWIESIEVRGDPPSTVSVLLHVVRNCVLYRPLSEFHAIDSLNSWGLLVTLLTLHAIADDACKAINPEESSRWFRFRAGKQLTVDGSLCENINPDSIRVLRKFRTPQTGITIRSLSHHLTCHKTGINVSWRKLGAGKGERETEGDKDSDAGSDLPDGEGSPAGPKAERFNLLLIPWPFRVDDIDFEPSKGNLANMDKESFGFFEFRPKAEGFLGRLDEILKSATQSTEVHLVVLPEAALTELEFERAASCLEGYNIPYFLSGVRSERRNVARLANLGATTTRTTVDQPKHHRWCLDGSQIRQYELGFQLDPQRRWWENIDIARRKILFVEVNQWLTLCPLICEDLARIDPVGALVRGVGPPLAIALLQDGPQLKGRWPARYATVLADDPGSSVLTLSSLGMAQRSTGLGHPPSRVVGLWKDPFEEESVRELELEEGADGLLLCLSPQWLREWCADGRSYTGSATALRLIGQKQVRCPNGS